MKRQTEADSPIRVMVVDDSPVTRRLIDRVIARADGLEVVAELGDGKQAVEVAIRERIEVLILDLEMPEIDGREVLLRLFDEGTQMGVVIYTGADPALVKELEQRVSRRLLCCVMPKGSGAGGGVDGLKDSLVPLLIDLGKRVRSRKSDGGRTAPSATAPRPGENAAGSGTRAALNAFGGTAARSEATPRKVEPAPAPPAPLPRVLPPATASPAPASSSSQDSRRFGVLVIGASTGGPEALRRVIQELPGDFPIPVAVVQHMPIGFTAQLAARLDSQCAISVREAQDGERLEAGCVLIAPGGQHLEIHRDGPHLKARLTEGEPENSCRPAVDVLFRSAGAAVPRHILAVVLTGMGQDGLVGAEIIRQSGGLVLVQDEATSVVWGMPGAIAKAGAADEVLPLDEVGPRIVEHVRAGRLNRRAI